MSSNFLGRKYPGSPPAYWFGSRLFVLLFFMQQVRCQYYNIGTNKERGNIYMYIYHHHFAISGVRHWAYTCPWSSSWACPGNQRGSGEAPKWLVLGIFGGHQGCYDIFYLGKSMSMLILSNKYQGLKPIHQSTRHSWRHLALHFGGDANDLKNETSFPNQSISAAPCSIHMRHHWCCSPLEKTRSEMEMDQRQPQLQVWHSFCSSIHEWNQIWNLGRKGVDLNFDWSTPEWSCGMNDGG